MNHLVFGIVKATPKLMERTTLNVNLAGWPAAVTVTGSVALVCGAIVYSAHTSLKKKELEVNQIQCASVEGDAEGADLEGTPSRENLSS